MSTKLFTEKEVADQYPVTVNFLRNSRFTGKGFPFVKIGGRVFYREEDIEIYIKEHIFNSTLEYQHHCKQLAKAL